MQSILSAPIEAGGERVGALNLYSSEPNAFGDTAEAAASPLARRAADVIAGSKVFEVSRKLVNDMEATLEARELIGQAKGILMTRHNVGPERAADLLRERSEQVGRGLGDVAEDLVRGRHHGGTGG